MFEEILRFVGFSLLVLRSSYWIFMVWEKENPGWKVFLGELLELFLLLFIFSQVVGLHVLPMPHVVAISLGGFFLTCGGILLSFLGKYQLGNNWWYAGAKKKPQTLVTSGLYAHIRHPIYLGFVLSFVGMELLLGSYLWVSFLVLFIPLYMQAKKEEAMLEKQFGFIYRKYRGETKMVVPGIF